MSDMNVVPSSERLHISFFGCRNAGKSSVVNAVTGQELSIVSPVKGTTTDPVTKAMELLPLGPVVIIDTPGIDDEGSLGQQRVRRTRQTLNRTDVAVLVVDGTIGPGGADRELIGLFRDRQIPYIIVYNKLDLVADPPPAGEDGIWVSAEKGLHIHQLKERIGALTKTDTMTRRLVGQLLRPGDLAVLVCPIDESAPKGRMILPQQQAIRDVLEAGAIALVTREHELAQTLESIGGRAALVVTDSQAFQLVSSITPEDIPLTSFSILMANYKGFLKTAVAGAAAMKGLRDGDTVLVAEGCTHHRQCNDIGTVKLPGWLEGYTGKSLRVRACSGREFPEDLSDIALVLHCGGCMVTEREMRARMRSAMDQGVPFTNYGVAIAQMTGILERSLRPLPDIHRLLEGNGAVLP